MYVSLQTLHCPLPNQLLVGQWVRKYVANLYYGLKYKKVESEQSLEMKNHVYCKKSSSKKIKKKNLLLYFTEKLSIFVNYGFHVNCFIFLYVVMLKEARICKCSFLSHPFHTNLITWIRNLLVDQGHCGCQMYNVHTA